MNTILLDTPSHRITVGGNPADPTGLTQTKLVGMGTLGELLPDAVLVELEDFKSDTNALPAKRQAAARVLMRINSNVEVDILHDDFTILLTKLVTHTSLTGAQATTILDTLKSV